MEAYNFGLGLYPVQDFAGNASILGNHEWDFAENVDGADRQIIEVADRCGDYIKVGHGLSDSVYVIAVVLYSHMKATFNIDDVLMQQLRERSIKDQIGP